MFRPFLTLFTLLFCVAVACGAEPGPLERIDGAKPRNVIYILTDDHRYDVMSYMGHPWVETPHMDAMARNGVHFASGFVTTALCSPSRASVLSGMYVHKHKVVDNNDMMSPEVVIFPQYLQKLGYQTGFFGKWHMGGESDEPRPGFDRWMSFRGQGNYFSPNPNYTLNVDVQRVKQDGYITDMITDYTLDWLGKTDRSKPFFAYVSHKAVHGMFHPAERHKGRYKDKPMPRPRSMANTPENYEGKPMWVKNQRNSWHGVDFAYHDANTPIEQLYRDYCESLLAVDESIGRIMKWLKDNNLDKSTLVIYMGDNGFQWGEHGLIDKRTAYEASIRVPYIAHCPDLFKPGTVVPQVVANIDIGPTILEAAGAKAPADMDGRSWLQLASGKMNPDDWRKGLLYEYYWEWNFPHTPTVFALRGDKYKLMVYHGIWDTDELYDIQSDPEEMRNLIHDPRYKEVVTQMRRDLWEMIEGMDANQVPFGFKRGDGANLRHESGAEAADFPPRIIRDEQPQKK